MTAIERTLLPLALADVPAALRRALAQEGVPTCDFFPNTLAKFVLIDGATGRIPSLGVDQRAIDVDELRRDFSDDPFQQLDDLTTVRSRWRVGGWVASEETAMVDKRAVRATVVAWLRRKVESLGGVWMRTAPYPHPYRSAFNFRFDHDAYVANDFDAVLDAIAGHEGVTTHFVCAATHEAQASALARLADCDVGSHGYRHHTYRTLEENIVNISRGIETLQRLGLRPNGFAAPHGRYHPALATAMQSLGLPFSSEFAAAYDDLPAPPPHSDILQLPVHPVCLGIVLEATDLASPGDRSAKAQAAAAIADYFVSLAALKRTAREPIFLYGHPDGRLGRYPQILRRLFDVVDAWPDVWQTTFSEFARWWRQRSTIGSVVRETADGYELQHSATTGEFPCAVEWYRGESSTFVPLDRPVVSLHATAAIFEPLPSVDLPRPVGCESIGGVRERLRRALDWEYVTPIDEIDRSHWRGRVKRSLRNWKSRTA